MAIGVQIDEEVWATSVPQWLLLSQHPCMCTVYSLHALCVHGEFTEHHENELNFNF